MAGITWLHLSDWHQRGNEFNRKIVRDGLIMDIRNRARISPNLAKIDLIIFSGDIAYSGLEEEYNAAIEFLLNPLLQEVQLRPDRLFIIPGNHDMDWKQLEFLPVGLTKPLDTEQKVQYWLDDKNRHHVLEPFQAFDKFVTNYTGQKQPTYATSGILEINGKKIALLGLNSALMCGRHKERKKVKDLGYLFVGEPQLYDGLSQVEDAYIRIAVLHHPLNWLMEFDAVYVEERLGEKCHFILCGHQHKPSVKVEIGTVGKSVVIPAGAGYGSRFVSNPRYINAYNFVHFDFKTFEGTVYLRRWSDQRNIFREDIDSSPHQGQFSFQLKPPDYSSFEVGLATLAFTQSLKDEQGQTVEPHKQDTAFGSKAQNVLHQPIIATNTKDRQDTLPPSIQPYVGSQASQQPPAAIAPAAQLPTALAPLPPEPAQRSETRQIGRKDLLDLLARCPSAIFMKVVVYSDVPEGILPGDEAPQAIRAAKLLHWAESGEIGLRKLYENYQRAALRGCVDDAQWYVKKAYNLLDPAMSILPENIANATEFLKTAKGDIEHLEELLQEAPPLPEHGSIIDQVRIITDQIDQYLIPHLKPSESPDKGFQKRFVPLLNALNKLDTLIPE